MAPGRGAGGDDEGDYPESDSDAEGAKPATLPNRSPAFDAALRSLVARLIRHFSGSHTTPATTTPTGGGGTSHPIPNPREYPPDVVDRMRDELVEIETGKGAAARELAFCNGQIRNLNSRKAEIGQSIASASGSGDGEEEEGGGKGSGTGGKGGRGKGSGARGRGAQRKNTSGSARNRVAGDILAARYIGVVESALQVMHTQRAKAKQALADLEARKAELEGVLAATGNATSAAGTPGATSSSASGASTRSVPAVATGGAAGGPSAATLAGGALGSGSRASLRRTPSATAE